ncbi:MAG: helicase-related protein, partial [Sphingomonadales bacterium]
QAVARAMAEYNLTGLLSYHGRIDEAAEFARLLRAQGIGAAHVHGHMAVSTVNRQLKRLVSGSPFVLCNAKLLGEGIDVPAVDGVILNTAKKSVVDITQAIGRAARRTPGKDRGYVILPLHCAKRENFEAAILSQQYAFTWQALLRLFDIYQMPDRSTDLTPESSIEARQPTIRVIGKTAPGAAIDQLIQRFTEVRRLSLAQFVWMQKANNLLTHLRAGDGVVTSGLNDWLCYNRKRAAAGDLPADQIAVLDEIQHLIDERKSDVTNIRSRRLEAYVEAIESGARLTIDINSLQSLAENRNIHSDLHKRYLRIRYNRAAEDLKKMMAAVAAYGQPNASKKHKAIYDRIRDNPNDYPELWRELLAARQARKNRNMREIQEYLAAVEAGQPATQNARIYGRIMAHPEIYKAEIARLRAAKAANGVTRPRPAVGKLLAVINDKWSSTDQIAGALGKQRKTTYTLLMKALLRGQVERRRGDGSLYLWRRSVARRSAGDDLLS